MRELQFSISEMVELSGCIDSPDELLSLFSAAAVPLGSFGISVRGNYIVLVTDNNDDDESAIVYEAVYVVDRACNIMDLVVEDILIIDSDSNSDALDYYNNYQCDCGDDTAFDYHGTYVQAILDAMLSVARKRGGGTL